MWSILLFISESKWCIQVSILSLFSYLNPGWEFYFVCSIYHVQLKFWRIYVGNIKILAYIQTFIFSKKNFSTDMLLSLSTFHWHWMLVKLLSVPLLLSFFHFQNEFITCWLSQNSISIIRFPLGQENLLLGTSSASVNGVEGKSRKYQGVFEAKSRVKTWQVRGIWSQQLKSKIQKYLNSISVALAFLPSVYPLPFAEERS